MVQKALIFVYFCSKRACFCSFLIILCSFSTPFFAYFTHALQSNLATLVFRPETAFQGRERLLNSFDL